MHVELQGLCNYLQALSAVFWSLSCAACPPQLDGAGAAQASYSAWKAAAGRYQRALQTFTGALQDAGLGTWLRKPPEGAGLHSTPEQKPTRWAGFVFKKLGEVQACEDS